MYKKNVLKKMAVMPLKFMGKLLKELRFYVAKKQRKPLRINIGV